MGTLVEGQIEVVCRRGDESFPVVVRLSAFTPSYWTVDIYRPNPRAIGGIGERLLLRGYQAQNLSPDLRQDELRIYDDSYVLDQEAMRRLRALAYKLGALSPLEAPPGPRARLSLLAERQLARASG